VEAWLQLLDALLCGAGWRNPFRPARDHKKESDFRLRVMAEAETARLRDQSGRDG